MRKRHEQRLDAEMRAHVHLATQDYITAGLSPDEARRRALIDFGAVELAKDEVRDLRPLRWVDEATRDVSYTVRQLRHSPAFTLAIALTLAVAMAANSALFSAVRAVVLKPLPYHDANRLLCIWHGGEENYSWYTFSHPRFLFFQRHLLNEAELAAYDDEVVTVSGGGEPARIEGGRVSANFFSLLGVKPEAGRFFRADEDRHGANPVAVLSHRFWSERYGGNPAILGRSIRIDDGEYTIVGIVPAGFEFLGQRIGVWRSRIVDTRTFAPASVQLGASYLTVIARMRPGVSLSQLRMRLLLAGNQYSKDNPGNSDIVGQVSAAPLQWKIFAGVRTILLVLWGAVICLLAIASANVANLMLARGIARSNEISVKLALGASSRRIAQQVLIEMLLLCGGSVVLSLPLTILAMRFLFPSLQLVSPSVPEVQFGASLMLFTIAVAGLVGVAVGMIQILVLLKGHPQTGLRAQDRNYSTSRLSVRLRNSMVTVQVALSIMLLAVTGLLARSLLQLRTMRTGLQAGKVDVFPLDLMPDRYGSWEHRVSFYQEVLRRVETLPGITGAAIADRIDLVAAGLGYLVEVEGAPDLGSGNPVVHGRSVTPGYFQILGIPVRQGRVFNLHDTAESERVVVINEAFAKKFFPGVNPIGKHITYSTDPIQCEVIGVTGNVRSGVQDTGVDEQIYLPLSQRPWLVAKLLVRAATTEGLGEAIRQRVRSVDPEQAVADLRPLRETVANRLEGPTTAAIVAAFFAISSLFLVAVGIYGVVAYSVAQRRREIGIRMALGADTHRVRALVFGQIIRVLGIGLVVGLPAAVMLGRFYSSLLFATKPGDPVALAITTLMICAVALSAAYLPARRATRTDIASILLSE